MVPSVLPQRRRLLGEEEPLLFDKPRERLQPEQRLLRTRGQLSETARQRVTLSI